MIAASEEFLSLANFGRNSEIHSTDLHLSALRMGELFDEYSIGYGRSVHGMDSPFIGAGLRALQMAGVSRCGMYLNIEDGAEAIRKSVANGMPFVGWSINADSRRITGPAQPGEGEFIKYLGRDF